MEGKEILIERLKKILYDGVRTGEELTAIEIDEEYNKIVSFYCRFLMMLNNYIYSRKIKVGN